MGDLAIQQQNAEENPALVVDMNLDKCLTLRTALWKEKDQLLLKREMIRKQLAPIIIRLETVDQLLDKLGHAIPTKMAENQTT